MTTGIMSDEKPTFPKFTGFTLFDNNQSEVDPHKSAND